MADTRRGAAWFLFGVLFCGLAVRTAAAGGIPPELQDVGERWLEDHWSGIEEHRTHLIVAYGIGPDEMDAFLHLYYGAWRGYRDHQIAFAESISLDDSPEEARQKLMDFEELSPVSEKALMAVTESILPARDFIESRSRFTELNAWATAHRYKEQDDGLARYELSKAFNARSALTAIRDGDGRPMPRHEAVAKGMTAGEAVRPGEIIYSPETVAEPAWVRPIGCGLFRRPVDRVRPIVKSINDAETLSKVFPPVKPDASEAPLVDPAEDDWVIAAEGALASFCAGVDGPRCEKAERLVKEILRRASIVRHRKAESYEALESLTSRRAFSEALAGLDEELDGLQAELSARLEGLKG